MSNSHKERQHAKPLLIDRLDDSGTALTLKQISFAKSADGDSPSHDEGWLQKLIFRFPHVLSVREIEPGFSQLISICLELPTPAGSADNLFVTDNGNLVIAECKLWRNPEARREVVAQIIDYAHSMASWSYEDFETSIHKGILPDGSKIEGSLYSLIEEKTDLSELDFIDAVSRNLRLGRLLLLIVGDGIREGVETLTEYLQMHAGFHFTLSIIEMPVFQLPNEEGFVVQPRVLAKTVNIERGIVRLDDDRVSIEPPERASERSISKEQLLEKLRKAVPEVPEALNRFLQKAGDLGVVDEMATKSLQLRWYGPEDQSFALGAIDNEGNLQTYNVGWSAGYIGHADLAHKYLEDIASLIGGKVRQTKKPTQWYVVSEGTTLPKAMALLSRQDEWLNIIESYTEKLASAMSD